MADGQHVQILNMYSSERGNVGQHTEAVSIVGKDKRGKFKWIFGAWD